MTPAEKLRRAEEREHETERDLVAIAAKHTRQGRYLVELIGAARRHTNAAHAVGRARKAVRS